jgi:hypothetical protein
MYAAQPLVPEVVPSYEPVVAPVAGDDPMAGAPENTNGETGDGSASSDGSTTTDVGAVDAEGSLSNPAEAGGSGEVYVYTVDIAADGGPQELFSFLTTIYAMHGIEITSWDFQEAPPSLSDDWYSEEVSLGTVNLQLKIYVFLGEVVE